MYVLCLRVGPPFDFVQSKFSMARTRSGADVRIRPDVSLSVITAFLYYSM